MQWDKAEIKLHVLAFSMLHVPKEMHMLCFKLYNYCWATILKNIAVDMQRESCIMHLHPHINMERANRCINIPLYHCMTMFCRSDHQSEHALCQEKIGCGFNLKGISVMMHLLVL